jgi:hypothetical protein
MIALAANVAIALSFVAAIVFGVFQVRAVNRDRKERLTLDTLKTFQTREFAEIIYFIREIKVPLTGESFTTLSANEQILLIQASQQMESLGMLVYEKLIDLDLVDKTIGSLVSLTWEKYRPMFTDMRTSLPDPYLGEYFQWLAEQVDKKIQEARQPYYL